MKKYEIREVGTNELLVPLDNLPKDEAFEMFETYQNFFGIGKIYLTHYEAPESEPQPSFKILRTYESKRARDYKDEYIALIAELQEMGNIL